MGINIIKLRAIKVGIGLKVVIKLFKKSSVKLSKFMKSRKYMFSFLNCSQQLENFLYYVTVKESLKKERFFTIVSAAQGSHVFYNFI